MAFMLQRSYIFQRRPLTPPRFIKQTEYSGDLAKQVGGIPFSLYEMYEVEINCMNDEYEIDSVLVFTLLNILNSYQNIEMNL